MSYYHSVDVSLQFDEARQAVTAALAERGFGILTTIDVQATFQKKLGENFRPYTILGACNPQFAHQALQCEPNIGAMLPCNVVVQQWDDGRVSVSAVDPGASMAAVQDEELTRLARDVSALLRETLDALPRL